MEAPPVPAARLTPAPVEKVKPKESRSTDALLAEERSLLEMARTAMMSGRYKEAAQTLEQHRAKFPKGRLREERESLTIQLLLSSGDVEKARQALEVFSKQFPNSMFLPGLKDALP